MKANRRIRSEIALLHYMLVIASFCAVLGPFVPMMELAEHFAVQYVIAAVVLAAAALWFQDKPKFVVCLALLFYHGYTIASVTAVSQPSAEATGQPFTILQFNALYRNSDPEAIAQIEAMEDVDLIVMNEYPANPVFDDAFKENWPYTYRPMHADVFFSGIALFSKHPFKSEALHAAGLDSSTGVWRLEFAEQGLVVYAVHSPTPIPSDAAEQRDKQHRWLMPMLAGETLPAVALGDFNQTPYVRNFRKLLERNRIHLAPFPQSVLPTWPSIFYLPILQVPIDLLLANEHATIINRERVLIAGSDHVGVKNIITVKPTE